MEQKQFIEILVGGQPVLIAKSSIAMVEPNGGGATIIMKEINKDGKSYVIPTATSYYTIKADIY